MIWQVDLIFFGEHGTPTQGAFWNIYDSIIAVRDLIKETWNSIFSISDFSSYSGIVLVI